MKRLVLIFFFNGLFSACNNAKKFISVSEVNGNIFFYYSDSSKKQMTFDGKDKNVIISPDEKAITFIRTWTEKTKEVGSCCWDDNSLYHIDIKTKQIKSLVSEVRSEDMKQVIVGIYHPEFNLHSDTIFFMTPAWATQNAMHGYSLKNNSVFFIKAVGNYNYIKKGRYKGLILATADEYNDSGHRYFRIIMNSKGEVLTDLGENLKDSDINSILEL
jgi:hypothetical protein